MKTKSPVYMAGMRFFSNVKDAQKYAKANGYFVLSSNGNIPYDYRRKAR